MENNEILKTEEKSNEEYTVDEILKAISKLSEDKKKSLLKITFENIHGIANNLEYRKSVIEYFDKAIEELMQEQEAVGEFISLIENQGDSKEEIIDDMISNYKKFSRSERLEFNKKLQGENNLPESLDMFEYTWNKFVDKLRGVV